MTRQTAGVAAGLAGLVVLVGAAAFAPAALAQSSAPDDAASALRHFCLLVDDLGAMRRRLEDAGVATWDSEPIHGRPRFFCSDPAGNSIEFTSIDADYRSYQDS